MTDRVLRGILISILGGALSNCGTNPTTPTSSAAPLTLPQPSTPNDSVLANATLFGTVYEVVSDSPRQIVGIAGVAVYCEQCGESTHNYAYTDWVGQYRFPPGVWTEGRPTFPVRIWIQKDGYKDPPGLPKTTPPNPSSPGWREVVINGDTRFDAQLVRQK